MPMANDLSYEQLPVNISKNYCLIVFIISWSISSDDGKLVNREFEPGRREGEKDNLA